MKTIAWAAACVAGLASVSVHADLVTDWCEKATTVAYQPAPGTPNTPATTGSRHLTMTHIAMWVMVRWREPVVAGVLGVPGAGWYATVVAFSHQSVTRSAWTETEARPATQAAAHAMVFICPSP